MYWSSPDKTHLVCWALYLWQMVTWHHTCSEISELAPDLFFFPVLHYNTRHFLFPIFPALFFSTFLSKAAPGERKKKKREREREKEAGHHGTSNLAPRVAFVLSKGLWMFLLKRGTTAAQSTWWQHLASFCLDDNDRADYEEAGI